jgi:hypothetical protein
VRVSRQSVDGAFAASNLGIVDRAPFTDLAARIASTGVSITPTPGHDGPFGNSASYRVGPRSEYLFIFTPDASSAVGSAPTTPAPLSPGSVVKTTQYSFRAAGVVVLYYGHGAAGDAIARRLSRVLGSPQSSPFVVDEVGQP